MKLSVVIPAYNEGRIIGRTLSALSDSLHQSGIDYEIIVVNDYSNDNTTDIVKQIMIGESRLRLVDNKNEKGYGSTCISGIEAAQGDCLAFFMADLSDSPDDLVVFFRRIESSNCDMVFGDRWSGCSRVKGYPLYKRIANRLANHLIATIFSVDYYDITNGFKLYKRYVIDSLWPFKSKQFNFALELPLRAVVEGFCFEVVENRWENHLPGKSNLKLMRMSGKYMRTLVDCIKQKYCKK